MSIKTINFATAINEAILQAMEQDDSVICYGLGTDDPKGVFGTTLGLQEKFGPERVFDMPVSENAMTGVAIGAALNGTRSIVTHQRLDFFLLAMDQLVNNAAKWHYMFGGRLSVPITIRLILGRGWGQGPTHSQNLQSWFAHVPGLKVVMPATAASAKGLLLSAVFDDNPVIFLEHRWLHNQLGEVPSDGSFRLPLDRSVVMRKGTDITIVSMSYMTVEALRAIKFLEEKKVDCELIDLCSVNPIDWKTIISSVRKTGRLLVLDTGWETLSVAGEIIARCAIECFAAMKCPPGRIALPDCPTPTSRALTKYYYKDAADIARKAAEMLGLEITVEPLVRMRGEHHDVPGGWFKGPF